MSWPTVPNSFSPATKARSSEINSNFSAIKDAIASSVTKSNTDYVITDTDGYRVILVSTGDTTRTITLPTAADNSQRIITIKKVDSGTGAVTIDGENSETIDGQLTKSLNVQYDFYELQCDGTNWNIISTSSASSGSGAGSVNYIQTSSKSWDMEATITGWNTYKDAAAATPADGTGGSPTVITIARNTTTPLNGVADLKISKSAANGQGEGVSIDVTVPSGYQYAQKGQIKLLLNSNTTNFVAGDFVFYVYDVTNSTLITPNVTSMSKYKGAISITWDSSATGTSYRLIMHCAVTTTLAYDIYIDDVIFGPGVTAQGAVVGAWQSYTPTYSASFGSTSNSVGYWRRVGTDMEIVGSFNPGTVTAALATVSIPSGYTINTSNLALPSATSSSVSNIVGEYSTNTGSSGAGYTLSSPGTSLTNLYFGIRFHSAGVSAVPDNASASFANTNVIPWRAKVPIAEWAGSGTVNLGNNGVEYASVSGTWDANASTTVYGPAGQLMGGTLTAAREKTITWQTPVQATDRIQVWASKDQVNWFEINGAQLGASNDVVVPSLNTTNTNNAGVSWRPGASANQSIIVFAQFMALANDDSPTVNWPSSAAYWVVTKSVPGQAVGFGLATATQSGLLPPTTSMGDDLATALGYKTYLHGTSYNGGNAPTVTLSSGGGSLTSVIRASFTPYKKQDGSWWMKIEAVVDLSSTSRTQVVLAVNGVTFKNLSSFNQPLYSWNGGSNVPNKAYTGINNGNITCDHAAATAGVYGIAGDVELESKPTWAY